MLTVEPCGVAKHRLATKNNTPQPGRSLLLPIGNTETSPVWGSWPAQPSATLQRVQSWGIPEAQTWPSAPWAAQTCRAAEGNLCVPKHRWPRLGGCPCVRLRFPPFRVGTMACPCLITCCSPVVFLFCPLAFGVQEAPLRTNAECAQDSQFSFRWNNPTPDGVDDLIFASRDGGAFDH